MNSWIEVAGNYSKSETLPEGLIGILTIIIQSGKHGSFLGKLYLEVDDRKVSAFEHELITIEKEIQPESQVQEIVDGVKDRYCSDLCQVVGTVKTGLNRDTVLKSTMDNFLLRALLNISGAEISFSNGWRYGAPVPPGPITLNDLWNIIPTNPPVSVVELKGKEIWAMMEENLEHTFSRDPYNQMGGYVKRCLGLNIYFKIENPPMARINEVFIGGKPIELDRTYKTAFVTSQGVSPKYGTDRKDLDVDAISAMRQLLDKGPLESELNRSIIAV